MNHANFAHKSPTIHRFITALTATLIIVLAITLLATVAEWRFVESLINDQKRMRAVYEQLTEYAEKNSIKPSATSAVIQRNDCPSIERALPLLEALAHAKPTVGIESISIEPDHAIIVATIDQLSSIEDLMATIADVPQHYESNITHLCKDVSSAEGRRCTLRVEFK